MVMDIWDVWNKTEDEEEDGNNATHRLSVCVCVKKWQGKCGLYGMWNIKTAIRKNFDET